MFGVWAGMAGPTQGWTDLAFSPCVNLTLHDIMNLS